MSQGSALQAAAARRPLSLDSLAYCSFFSPPLLVFAIKLPLYLYRRGVITARSAGALLLGATVIGSAHWDKRETGLNLRPFPNLVVK